MGNLEILIFYFAFDIEDNFWDLNIGSLSRK